MTLATLAPGRRFRVDGMPELAGELLAVSESRALVKLDRPPRVVDFQDGRTGEWVRFTRAGGHVTTWSPYTPVIPST